MKRFKIFTKIFSLCLIACCLFITLGCGGNNGLSPEQAFTMTNTENKWSSETHDLKVNETYYFTFTTTQTTSPEMNGLVVKNTKSNTSLQKGIDFSIKYLSSDLEEYFKNPFYSSSQFTGDFRPDETFYIEIVLLKTNASIQITM